MLRRISSGVVTVLNVLTMIFSLLVVGYSIWLYAHDSSLCQKVLRKPLLFIGLALFVISLMGIMASHCRVSVVMYLYLIFMYLLILALIVFTVFVIVVTNRDVGKQISRKGFKEYRLGDYSNWLQNHVFNGNHWGSVKSCFVDAHVCSKLSGRHSNAVNFAKNYLSPLQSGCCKPPVYCGFKFHNATFWIVPRNGSAHQDIDCKRWSNNQNVLCYNCNSCKAGVLNNIKGQWRTFAIINGCFILLVVVIYWLGCFALKRDNPTSHLISRQTVPKLFATRSLYLKASHGALIAEVLAIKEGLLLAENIKVKNFVIESDCFSAVSLASKNNDECSDLDAILEDIYKLGTSLGCKTINFAVREANQAAHNLAIRALDFKRDKIEV